MDNECLVGKPQHMQIGGKSSNLTVSMAKGFEFMVAIS